MAALRGTRRWLLLVMCLLYQHKTNCADTLRTRWCSGEQLDVVMIGMYDVPTCDELAAIVRMSRPRHGP